MLKRGVYLQKDDWTYKVEFNVLRIYISVLAHLALKARGT